MDSTASWRRSPKGEKRGALRRSKGGRAPRHEFSAASSWRGSGRGVFVARKNRKEEKSPRGTEHARGSPPVKRKMRGQEGGVGAGGLAAKKRKRRKSQRTGDRGRSVGPRNTRNTRKDLNRRKQSQRRTKGWPRRGARRAKTETQTRSVSQRLRSSDTEAEGRTLAPLRPLKTKR